MKIDIEDVFAHTETRSEWNRADLSNVEFYKDGKLIDIPKDELKEWDFTGLHNVDFILMRDWD